MNRSYLEERVISAGMELCEKRIAQKGVPITPDDLRGLQIKTFSPRMQIFYASIGVVLAFVAVWVHLATRDMAVAITPLLFGCLNVAYALHGRPKRISEIESEINLMDVTTEIVNEFVGRMNSEK